MNNEPIAWIDEDGTVRFNVSWTSQMKGKEPIPLYASPVKELTDEEMVQAGYEIVDENPYDVTVRMEMLRKAPVKRLTYEDCQQLEELMGEYWDLAYRECRDGIILSTQANDCLNRFRAILRKARGK